MNSNASSSTLWAIPTSARDRLADAASRARHESDLSLKPDGCLLVMRSGATGGRSALPSRLLVDNRTLHHLDAHAATRKLVEEPLWRNYRLGTPRAPRNCHDASVNSSMIVRILEGKEPSAERTSYGGRLHGISYQRGGFSLGEPPQRSFKSCASAILTDTQSSDRRAIRDLSICWP
jgi:hypothetical protein